MSRKRIITLAISKKGPVLNKEWGLLRFVLRRELAVGEEEIYFDEPIEGDWNSATGTGCMVIRVTDDKTLGRPAVRGTVSRQNINTLVFAIVEGNPRKIKAILENMDYAVEVYESN